MAATALSVTFSQNHVLKREGEGSSSSCSLIKEESLAQPQSFPEFTLAETESHAHAQVLGAGRPGAMVSGISAGGRSASKKEDGAGDTRRRTTVDTLSRGVLCPHGAHSQPTGGRLPLTQGELVAGNCCHLQLEWKTRGLSAWRSGWLPRGSCRPLLPKCPFDKNISTQVRRPRNCLQSPLSHLPTGNSPRDLPPLHSPLPPYCFLVQDLILPLLPS